MYDSTRKPFSIGKVAELTGVSSSTLRSWESLGLLTPSKRSTGHRTFDSGDIERVRQIEALRRMQGLSLAKIRERLDHSDEDKGAMTVEPSAGGPAATFDGPEGPGPHTQQEGDENGYGTLGQHVRSLRSQSGMSLSALAGKVEMVPSHLSMFERGKAFPSPSKLAAIAAIFGKSLAEMLGGTQRSGSIVTRKGAGRPVNVFGPDVGVEQLHVGEALMDCEIWTLAPGARSNGAYHHAGEEFIFVVEGEFELAVDGESYKLLRQGDSAYFESTRSHRWRNNSSSQAVLLWINSEAGRPDWFRSPRVTAIRDAGRLPGEPEGHAGMLQLPGGARTFRVVDTHTAGHPTRVLVDPILDLKGEGVTQKRDDFRARYDHLRPLLLHEPRGHAATFGLVPVPSDIADFGAIFISSYSYLDMCGHATIGFARTLAALGRLPEDGCFTLETPAGIIQVSTRQSPEGLEASFENIPSYVETLGLDVRFGERTLIVDIAYGGCRYALVQAASVGLALSRDTVGQAMALGASIKTTVNEQLSRRQEGRTLPVDSILFYEDVEPGHWRQLIVLAANKFDRSPCGTGASARIAERVARGILSKGDNAIIENIFGLRFRASVKEVAAVEGFDFPKVIPVVSGVAHLSGSSTLIVEEDEPLPVGFLCQ